MTHTHTHTLRRFNTENFIKAQFPMIQMLKQHAVAWFEARYYREEEH